MEGFAIGLILPVRPPHHPVTPPCPTVQKGKPMRQSSDCEGILPERRRGPFSVCNDEISGIVPDNVETEEGVTSE